LAKLIQERLHGSLRFGRQDLAQFRQCGADLSLTAEVLQEQRFVRLSIEPAATGIGGPLPKRSVEPL
jgi:hypothetical protein